MISTLVSQLTWPIILTISNLEPFQLPLAGEARLSDLSNG